MNGLSVMVSCKLSSEVMDSTSWGRAKLAPILSRWNNKIILLIKWCSFWNRDQQDHDFLTVFVFKVNKEHVCKNLIFKKSLFSDFFHIFYTNQIILSLRCATSDWGMWGLWAGSGSVPHLVIPRLKVSLDVARIRYCSRLLLLISIHKNLRRPMPFIHMTKNIND